MQVLHEDITEIAERLKPVYPAFEGKSFLITGGKGFLGHYLCAVLEYLNKEALHRPAHVVLLDNGVTSRVMTDEEQTDFEFIQHDICCPLNIDREIDFIVHLAGIASPYFYRRFPLETLDVATLGTRNVLELARQKDAQVLYFSSSEIYGDPDANHIPIPESYRGNVACSGPRACYDESKRLGETLCYIYSHNFAVHVNTVRPFNVYGPGMREDDFRVLPSFASAIRGNQALTVYGQGNQTRTYTYITDAIVGFFLILAKAPPGEVYNIGNNKPELSVLDLVQVIEEVLGRTLEKHVIEYPDTYPGDEPQRRCPNIFKAKQHLGFKPEVSITDGISRFLSWSHQVYKGER